MLILSELEALQAATIKAAKSINQNNISIIQEGYISDLVILDNNPLTNITHTRQFNRSGKI